MAETMVVASIATHMRATLLIVTATSIASANRLPKMRNTRAPIRVRGLFGHVRPGQHGQARDGGDAAGDQRREGVGAEQRARPGHEDLAPEGGHPDRRRRAERHRARGGRQPSGQAGEPAERRRQRGRDRPRREEPGEEQRGLHLSASAA